MSDNLGDFLSGLQRDLTAVAQIDGNAPKKVQKDLDFEYFTTPAPNAIEWGVREEFLGVETMWHHTRQYQIIRDFFQLRCPLSSCNEQSVDARDCWGKSQQYLESENLLAWSSKYGEDVCPSCRSTRSELTADGLINLNTQCHVIAGMRTTYISTHLRTSSGLKRFKDLLPANPIPDTFYPLKDLKVFGEAGWEDVSDVYYSGEIESSTVKLKNGIEHVTSRVHPMYGFNDGVWGWHRANTIKPGAHIEVHAASDWVGKSTDITEDEASLMGYLISEGSINSEKAWKFTNGDEETIQHFNHLLGSAFNYHTAHTYIKKGTTCKTVDACNAICMPAYVHSA